MFNPSIRHSGRALAREPGIHNHRRCFNGEDWGYGFRLVAKSARRLGDAPE
jgi:hypothetical protein